MIDIHAKDECATSQGWHSSAHFMWVRMSCGTRAPAALAWKDNHMLFLDWALDGQRKRQGANPKAANKLHGGFYLFSRHLPAPFLLADRRASGSPPMCWGSPARGCVLCPFRPLDPAPTARRSGPGPCIAQARGGPQRHADDGHVIGQVHDGSTQCRVPDDGTLNFFRQSRCHWHSGKTPAASGHESGDSSQNSSQKFPVVWQ